MAGSATITAGSAYVRLYADASEYAKGLRAAEAKLTAFGNKVGSLGRQMASVAAAAAAPIALSVRTFAGFEDQMLAVQAVSRATREEFGRLYDQAKQLGASTSFTAGEVASGQLNLARQGFNPAEIEKAIPSVMNLARATGTDLALAADIASGTLRAFNMEAGEMPRIADVMVATANNSAQTLEDLGESMKYAAPIAAEYGLSIEQTSKALGVMANMQIKGTMAGTSLRQIMLQLADTGVQEQLRSIGVEALDARKNLRPLGDIMLDIGKAMEGMPNAERISLGKNLFDQRAVGGALKLISSDFDGLSKAIDNAAGVAERTAAIMDSGIGGSFRMLMSAVEGVQIAIGEGLSGMLLEWSTQLTASAQSVGTWVGEHQGILMLAAKLILVIGGLGAAFIAIAMPIKAAAAVAGVMSLAFSAITAPAAAATAAIGGLSAAMTFMAAHPVAIVLTGLAAVAAAMTVMSRNYQRMGGVMTDVRKKADEMRAADQALMKELVNLAGEQSLASDKLERAQTIIDKLQGKYGDLGLAVDSASGSITGLTEAQEALNSAMARQTIAQLKTEMIDSEQKIKELEDERGGFWRQMSEGFFATGYDKVLLDKIMAEMAKVDAIKERIRLLQGGDTDAITGDAGGRGEPAPGDLGGVMAKGGTATDAAEFNERILDQIAESRIQQLEDEQDRAVAAINKRYDAEMDKAKELGASLSLVTQARAEALKTADENYQRRRRDERERKEELKQAANQRLQDSIDREKVLASTGPGLARDQELLELERTRALEAAGTSGEDKKKINELYDLKLSRLGAEAAAKNFGGDMTIGSYSAAAAWRQAIGGKPDDKVAKKTDEVKQAIKDQEGILKEIERNTRGGVMGK